MCSWALTRDNAARQIVCCRTLLMELASWKYILRPHLNTTYNHLQPLPASQWLN